MKKTVLLDIKLPATNKHYDFRVPEDMSMRQIARLIGESMQLLEPDYYVLTPDAALLFIDTGQIQQAFSTPKEIGLVDGDAFVLV